MHGRLPSEVKAGSARFLRFFASAAMSRLRNVRTTRKRFVKEYFVQSELLFKPVFKKTEPPDQDVKKEYKKIREGIANSYLLL